MFFDEYIKAEYQKVIDKKTTFDDFLKACSDELADRMCREIEASKSVDEIHAVYKRYDTIWRRAKKEIGRWDFPLSYVTYMYNEFKRMCDERKKAM